MAKELVVGTLGVIFGEKQIVTSLKKLFNPLTAYSFLLMSLIYTPCIATMIAIKNEVGIKYLLLTIFYTLFLGWIVAVVFYQIACLL